MTMDAATQAVVTVGLVALVRAVLLGQWNINLSDGALQLLSLVANLGMVFLVAGATVGVTGDAVLPLLLQGLVQFSGVQGGYFMVKQVGKAASAQAAGVASAPTAADAGAQLGLPTVPLTPDVPDVPDRPEAAATPATA